MKRADMEKLALESWFQNNENILLRTMVRNALKKKGEFACIKEPATKEREKDDG